VPRDEISASVEFSGGRHFRGENDFFTTLRDKSVTPPLIAAVRQT
jgi:hypothetical protein